MQNNVTELVFILDRSGSITTYTPIDFFAINCI